MTTRAFIAQQRDMALGFMRVFTRGMQCYRMDKEFSKRILGKYGKMTDGEILAGAWHDYAPTLQKSPRPSLKGIQFMIENQSQEKSRCQSPNKSSTSPSPSSWRRADLSDARYK